MPRNENPPPGALIRSWCSICQTWVYGTQGAHYRRAHTGGTPNSP